jgi:rod shape-determining protein MreC
MGTGWARWRAAGTVAFLAAVSAGLVALSLAGRSPLQSLLIGAFRPALAWAGDLDPPRMGPDGGPDEVRRLEARNARLQHEVLRLRELLASASACPFDGKRYPFRGLPAQVICRAGAPGLRQMVIADRGARDGVRRGMGVAVEDRVIGRVHRADDDLCAILLLTDPACRVPCSLVLAADAGLPPDGADGPEGLCEGIPGREGLLRLRHVPQQTPVKPGARVVTSGLGGVFPAGMSVGVVEQVSEGSDLFLDIEARPSAGGGPLRSVMILLPAAPELQRGEKGNR